jgi:TolA-binding protein
MLRKTLLLLSLAVAPMAMLPVLTLTPGVVHAQEKGKIGAKVGKPLQKALDAANKKDFATALASLGEADAVSGKNAYEQFQINELFGFVFLQQKRYADAVRVYERNMTSGQLPAAQANDRLKLLAQLNFQLRNLGNAASYGNRWLKATGQKDTEMLVLVGQAYYLNKDYKSAVTYMGDAVNTAQKAGRKPDENWLLILQQSFYNLKDADGVNKVLYQLVRLYPKTEYWDILTSNLLRGAPNDDRVTLNIYRLMRQLGVMKSADDYGEMAIIALQQGLPAEAQAIMEQGYASKVLESGGDMARSKRILDQARKQAADGRRTLPQEEAEALRSPQGQADFALAQAYLGYGENEKAVAAIQRGLKKGGIRSPDEAYLLLGQAFVRLKNGAEARAAFAKVTGAELKELARVWAIYAGQI